MRLPRTPTMLAAAVVLAGTALPSIAKAESIGPGLDWMKAIVELDRLARSAERPSAPRAPLGRPAPSDDPNPQNLGNAWFGVAPRVTLVARDWASSTRVLGGPLAVVDQLRLSASTRMVVGRARLSPTRFAPFLQVGVGQWRVDRTVLPLTPHAIEVATQVGTGFELRLTRRWQVAAEASMTTLLREDAGGPIPQATLWSACLASRVDL